MDSNLIGLQKVSLKNITPDVNNGLIVGVIIAKRESRSFADAKSGNGTENKNRGVWNFTLRDSLRDYINATCWGEINYITQLDESFHVGDVVDVIKPKISIRKLNDHGEQFRPMVTSPYSLTLNEQSKISKHEGGDSEIYLSLLHLPTKPIASFIPLVDVERRGSADAVFDLDILGAVKSVKNASSISTKDGRQLQLREVTIFDQSCSSGVRLNIWDTDLIQRAACWKPHETILFITNTKADWSKFHCCTVLTMTSRSVLTEDPIGNEPNTLRNFAKTIPLETMDIVDDFLTSIPDLNAIQNVMSINQISNKIEKAFNTPDGVRTNPQFTALLYAAVTGFDLDGLSKITAKTCTKCQSVIPDTIDKCENTNCIQNSNGESEVKVSFDIRMSLSDHTGTLDFCRLKGQAAETSFGCSVAEFLSMDEHEKYELKWKFLLERCAVRILVVPKFGRNPFIYVLGMSLADPLEAASRLPHY